MIEGLFRKLFGSANDRQIKSYRPRVAAINALEGELEKLSDAELQARTDEFKRQLASGKTLDDILVPAFATVREASKRTLGQRHFDVQLIGGMVLHQGRISEMKTGEGKTLVATLPVYLNALAGRGVHVVTVNDYLARRDAEWMGQIYSFLGLSVGVIVHGLDDNQRRAAYACDITYGTNNEFGFDYLRDNMKMRLQDMVQFGFRLFPNTIYQEIRQAREDANNDATRAVQMGVPINLGARAMLAAEMSSKALALAAEVLEDLTRQHDNAPEATRAHWTMRREHLERLSARITEQQQSIQSGVEARDWDKVRQAVERVFRLTASLAVELQTGAQRHNTEASAVGVANEAIALAEQIIADLPKRTINETDAQQKRSEKSKTLESLKDQLKEPLRILGGSAAREDRRDAVETVSLLTQSVASQSLSIDQLDQRSRERADELANRAALLIGGGDAATGTQGGHVYAIVDEVDSILIDEARTPLIISGPLEDRSEFYNTIDTFIPRLDKSDYEVDEKQRTVTLTEDGMTRLEEMLRGAGQLKADSLYDVENVTVVHHVNQALRAHKLFQRDKDYIVRNGEVVIIDEFTGRMMPGRRYSEGLHQALEAKEHQPIQPESQTLASITFQNYFRMYEKLAGMTGTALTEADEFLDIYNLEVMEVPTNMPLIRDDQHDEVYRTNNEKYRSIIAELEDCKQRGQPVLVGTTSIEKSEQLAEKLTKLGWEQHDFTDPNAFAALYSGDDGAAKAKVFAVLNARYHEQEAYIVAQAGVPGAITIATNMAGRGTDIQLGGNADMRIRQELADLEPGAERERRAKEIRDQVARLKEKALGAGGLFVLGTERHESRRIDNQLRGRSGRQGDPGRSKFFLSLEDDLMRIFGTDKLDVWLARLGLQEGEAIIHPWINKALEKAQSKVEARNFDIRKNLLKFDNVMNDQRKVVFEQRVELMRDENVAESISDMRHAVIDDLVSRHVPENAYPEQWDTAGLKESLSRLFGLDLPVDQWAKEEGIADEELLSRIERRADEHMGAKAAQWTPDVMRYVEKSILLQTLDQLWRQHLLMLEHLRQVIGLRGYGQRDPLNEYKSESFHLFEAMIQQLREAVTAQLMRVQILTQPQDGADGTPDALAPSMGGELPFMEAHKIDPTTGEDEMAFASSPFAPVGAAVAERARERKPNDPTTWGKVGRNEQCPCGSGKKFKHCHGRYA